MKLIPILVFLFLKIHFSTADETYYRPDNKFPLEFVYLLNSVQLNKSTQEKESILKKKIKTYDQLAQLLDADKNHLFIKSEIYKTLFKYRPKNDISVETYKKDLVSLIKAKFLEDSKNDLSAFTTWFIEALITDLEQFFSQEIFKIIQTSVTNKQPMKNDKEKSFKKRLDLCLVWAELYLNLSAEEFGTSLSNVMDKITDRLFQYSILYQRLTSTGSVALTDDLAHFEITKKQPDKKGIAHINYILDLENMGLQIDRPKEPKLDWLPSDEPTDINIPTPKNNNIKMLPDKNEPIPINDWPIDIE